jgi:hypothetical protein
MPCRAASGRSASGRRRRLLLSLGENPLAKASSGVRSRLCFMSRERMLARTEQNLESGLTVARPLCGKIRAPIKDPEVTVSVFSSCSELQWRCRHVCSVQNSDPDCPSACAATRGEGRSSGSSGDQGPNTPRSKHSATEQRRRTKINDRQASSTSDCVIKRMRNKQISHDHVNLSEPSHQHFIITTWHGSAIRHTNLEFCCVAEQLTVSYIA